MPLRHGSGRCHGRAVASDAKAAQRKLRTVPEMRSRLAGLVLSFCRKSRKAHHHRSLTTFHLAIIWLSARLVEHSRTACIWVALVHQHKCTEQGTFTSSFLFSKVAVTPCMHQHAELRKHLHPTIPTIIWPTFAACRARACLWWRWR